MSAITFNIEIEEEADESFRFNYANDSTGLPMDLTGYRAEMQVRTGYSGNRNQEPAIIFTSEPGGGIVLGGTSGSVDLYISYEDTKDLWWTQAAYTLFLISPKGARNPLVKGFFTINRSATILQSTGLPDISTGSEPSPNNLGEGGLDSNG
jgi:hypothetical protein